ncbi:MAG: CoA transferase, partial [Dehalococcoidia bacterium]
TADGYMFVAAFLDNHWAALAETLGQQPWPAQAEPDLRFLQDPGLLQRKARLGQREAINAALERLLAYRTRTEWTEEFSKAGIPFAPVNTVEDAVSDPQVRSRNMIVEIPHPKGGAYKATGNPIKLSASDEEPFAAPPLLGQHTTEVLREVLGYPEERIQQLLGTGVVEQQQEA